MVTGYDWVKSARKKLELRTGRKPIPVWHITRGIDDFKKMCEDYPYVAIGGLASNEYPRKKYPALKNLIRISHRSGAKIHGLGFTNTRLLNEYHFDSVDSTSWLNGGKFGEFQKFDGKRILSKHHPVGMRCTDGARLIEHNFHEWIKYQKWAEVAI